MRKRILLIAVMVLACLPGREVQARLVGSFYLDGDVRRCQMVFVGTVEDVQVIGVEKSGTEILDVQLVSTAVSVPIKGNLKRGDRMTFRHRRTNASSSAVLNGYRSFDFAPQHTYLLLLQQTADGPYELPSPEDTGIVELSSSVMSDLQQLPRRDDPLDYVISLLVKSVEEEPSHCAAALWLLERSEMFQQQLRDDVVRSRFVTTLIRVTKSTEEDENTLTAAYTFLGKLNATSIISDLVSFITQERETKIIKSNAINWLQGFPAEEQIKTLRVIIEQAHDKDVLDYAKRRLESNLGVTQASQRVETESRPPQ